MANEAVKAAITRAAMKYGVDPKVLMRFAQIESSMRPGARTGSYKGLFQLSDDEFAKHGGQGNIYSPEANADAGAAKLKREMGAFKAKYGRDPTPSDLYMVHQQGEAGYGAHMAKPDGVAWQNVRPYYTDEAARKKGFASGDAYAKAAIWGNVPDDVKARYPGGVDSLTSKDFVDLWNAKVNREGTGSMVASTQPSEDKGMLNILSALGMGKTLGATGGAAAGGDNIFGSLSSLFGGGGGDSNNSGSEGDMGMKLAQNAMSAAAGAPDEQQSPQLRKPMDLAMLSKILQQRGMLGTAQSGGKGLGVG